METQRKYFLFLSLVLLSFQLALSGQGNLVLDARWISTRDPRFCLYGEELNYKYELPTGAIFLQCLNQTTKGERSDFRLGEAWLSMNFFDNVLIVKAGRIPLPFGLNAFYDPHFKVIQPLYQQSLGLRLADGACLSGRYGDYLFCLSASRSVRSSKNEKTTYIFRVEREIPSNPWIKGDFGFSLLSGYLPLVDEFGITPLTIDKTRIGLDFNITKGKSKLLGEAHIGGDKDTNVGGFFLLGEVPLQKNLKLIISWRSFNFDVDKGREMRMGSAGVSWDISDHHKLSLVYQRDYFNRKNIYTLQLLTVYSLSDLVKKGF